MFGDDEDIRSDKDLAEDYRRGIVMQDKLIAQYHEDNTRLREQLRSWVPHPSKVSGWDDPDCPDDVAKLIREACEIHGVQVPDHLIETR